MNLFDQKQRINIKTQSSSKYPRFFECIIHLPTIALGTPHFIFRKDNLITGY